MTETCNQSRKEQLQVVASESVRSARTIPTRVVPDRTLYLELSVRRDFFEEGDSIAGEVERHPEWYIG